MREAVIVSAARTPIGRAFRGAFNQTPGATLAGHVVRHAMDRAGISPAEVDDVVIGSGLPEGFKSMALGLIFQDYSRTLNIEEIDVAVGGITASVSAQLGASVRG